MVSLSSPTWIPLSMDGLLSGEAASPPITPGSSPSARVLIGYPRGGSRYRRGCETAVIDRWVVSLLCVGPPGKQWYFSPRNTCIVDGTCSGIFLRIMRHVPLGFFYLFTMPLLWRLFRRSFDQRPAFFLFDSWSVFLWHGGLVKEIPPCTVWTTRAFTKVRARLEACETI